MVGGSERRRMAVGCQMVYGSEDEITMCILQEFNIAEVV